MLVLDLYEPLDFFASVCELLNLASYSFSPVSVSIDRVSLLILAYCDRRMHIQLILALSHATVIPAETRTLIAIAASLRDELCGNPRHRLLSLVMELFKLSQLSITLLLPVFLSRGP